MSKTPLFIHKPSADEADIRLLKSLTDIGAPSEVSLMAELADWLDSWAEQCPTTDKEKFMEHRAKLLKVTREQDTILEWLSWHKPELKKTVEDKIGELYCWSLSDLPNENDLTYNTMRLTTGCARILAETLRHIAKMASGNAGEKKNSEKTGTSLEGEWSDPMTKSAMMSRVGIDGYKKFNTFAKQYGLRKAGSRQLWQIRLDGMDKTTRQKLEKA